MDSNESAALLTELAEKGSSVPFEDEPGFEAFRRRGWMLLRNIFGNASPYVRSWNAISFVPGVFAFDGNNDARYRESWQSGMTSCISLLKTAIEEVTTFGAAPGTSDALARSKQTSRRVFVVHGHGEGLKEKVARLLAELDLDPIILHEQPNKSRALIEKFEAYSDVGFAVVLLTPDDLGFEKGAKPELARPRARQNVIFELGFFVGRLDRANVAALFAGDEHFDKPSDYDGVTYIPLDGAGKWKYDLATELQAAGIEVDKNRIS